MIRTWWKDGAWGGVPVRRLGHVMADVINAVEQARTPYPKTGPFYPGAYSIQGDDALVSSQWIVPGGGVLTLPATAAMFNGCAVGDPCIMHNFREALRFLEGITEVDPSGHTAGPLYMYYVNGGTSLTPPSKSQLGIEGITEASLFRPQQVQPWAVLREALSRLRHIRRVVILDSSFGVAGAMAAEGTVSVGIGGAGGVLNDNSSAAALGACNAAIGVAIKLQDVGEDFPGPVFTDKVSASATWNFPIKAWDATANTSCFESVTLKFRFSSAPPWAGTLLLFDLPVTRAEIRFANGGTVNERVSSATVTVDGDADTITDGKEISWNGPKEEVVIAFTGTRTSSVGSVVWNSGTSKWEGSKGFAFIVDRVGVNYDLDAVEE